MLNSIQNEDCIPVVAHHEAGHAVICFVLYGEEVIRTVSVYDRNRVNGQTATFSRLPIPIVCRPPVGEPRRGNPAPVSKDAIVDAHGVLSYAGLAAEHILEGDPSAEGLASADVRSEERAMADREALATLAGTVGASRPAEHFFPEYWEEARRLLRVHWHGVQELAQVLEKHGSLNGDRVDTLLRAHCSP
jgi:hypothetical protein